MNYKYASPKNFYPLAGQLIPWLAGATAVFLLLGLYLGLLVAPPDYQQGESYRIMFVHVPSAWMSLFVYVVMAGSAGVRGFDSSTGGTGGCPYAPGAAGNLATEDLVYFLDASGWDTGVSLEGVLIAARSIAEALGRPLATKVGQAGGWAPGPSTSGSASRPSTSAVDSP